MNQTTHWKNPFSIKVYKRKIFVPNLFQKHMSIAQLPYFHALLWECQTISLSHGFRFKAIKMDVWSMSYFITARLNSKQQSMYKPNSKESNSSNYKAYQIRLPLCSKVQFPPYWYLIPELCPWIFSMLWPSLFISISIVSTFDFIFASTAGEKIFWLPFW
jgi:hypothetical protein